MKVALAYATVVLIWSTTPLTIKFSTDSLSFIAAVGLRMGLAGAVCLLICLFTRTPLRRDSQALSAYAAANIGVVGAMSATYLAVAYIPSGLVSVIFGLAPLLSGVFARWLLGEAALSPLRIGALMLSLGGLGLVFQGALALPGDALPGLLLSLLAVTLFALSGVLVKRQSAGMTALEHTTGSLLLSLPVFLLGWLIFDGQWPLQMSRLSLLSVGYLALFGSVFGFMLYFFVLQRLGPTQVALIPLITPVFALALGSLLAGEAIGALTFVGGALILLALAVYQGDARLQRWLAQRREGLLLREAG